MEAQLSPDTQTVLLLCGDLGLRDGNGPKPLGLRQYNKLASWLKDRGLRPADLLGSEGADHLVELQQAELNRDRLAPLLERGAALAFAAEKWERSGLWVISRGDRSYPERLKRYLGQAAPPLLYGVGPQKVLGEGGLAIVGSRDRSDEDGEFARRVGEQCAAEEIAVVSGAAKGVDRDAMSGALEVGGRAVGVLAEGLAKTATSGQYRSVLVNERLTLVSPYDPDSRWFAYTAMERNKLLYGLSDAALVVASAAESGGTWAGAVEALSFGKVHVYVKMAGVVAPGNPRLIARGALPFPNEPWTDLHRLMVPPTGKGEPSLFDAVRNGPTEGDDSATELETPRATEEARPPTEQQAPAPSAQSENASSPSDAEGDRAQALDAYDLVIDAILTSLQGAQPAEELADGMGVRLAQMRDWLERGVREGRIEKLSKPVRYVAQASTLFAK